MPRFGHRTDSIADAVSDLIERPARDLVGVGAPSAAERDWRFLDDTVFDQLESNSCVAQAAAESVYMLGQGAQIRGTGVAIPRPSRLHGYVYGQLEDQRADGVATDRRKILDVGMRARALLTAWSTYGMITEDRWPFSTETLHAMVAAPTMEMASKLIPFDVDVAGADVNLAGWYRATPSSAADEFRMALDACTFPIWAFDVYDNFVDYHGGVYSDVAGGFRGGHMVVVVAYRPGALCIKNSWGDTWGDHGYAWISDAFVNSRYARDGWLLKVIPALH